MKARVVTQMQACVLAYGIDDERRQALDAILQDMDIAAKYISDQDLAQSIGYLAGFAGFARKEEAGRHVDCGGCVVMCAMPNARMNAFLKALQTQGVNIPLKAMVTANNQSWSFCKLLEELSNEHAAIGRMQKKRNS